MADLNSLSDAELRSKLVQYNIADVPLTKTTRDLVIRRLKKAMENGNGSLAVGGILQESTSRRRSSMRNKSHIEDDGDVKAKAEDKSKSHVEDVGEVRRKTAVNRSRSIAAADDSKARGKNSELKVVNGKAEEPNGMDDEALRRDLKKYDIPYLTITAATRPILVKKLNHAMAKERRGMKMPAATTQTSFRDSGDEKDDEEEEQTHNDSSNASASRVELSYVTPSVTPSLSFSHQHSLTFGSYSTSLLANSKFKANSTEFPSLYPSSPTTPYSSTPANLPYTSTAASSYSATPNVINRFVEEQEPYDTGSDSEVDGQVAKPSAKRTWPLQSWFSRKPRNNNNTSTPIKKNPLWKSIRSKLNVISQWQFVSVFLPLLAIAFFLFLAAVYLRASYGEHPDTKDMQAKVVQLDSHVQQLLSSIQSLLERDASVACDVSEATSVDSVYLMHELNLNSTDLDQARQAVGQNPGSAITVNGDQWILAAGGMRFWCTLKTYFWYTVYLAIAVACGGLFHYVRSAAKRQCEKEEQEVYDLVENIIDVLCRHAASIADRRTQEPYLAVTHVRDVLIPLKERKTKTKVWTKAVQFLEEHESRIRCEVQQIEGEDYRVWRWLPSSTNYQGTKDAALGQGDETPGAVAVPAHRQKVWQGQAFSTGNNAVNSPPPYPLTQCLKVRKMFDADVEVGDTWPIRIQDAILEKAEGAKILHLAVDTSSKEGCVYIKCSNADEAGKVYRALHGWWFDGNLVTVKYLRPERYHYRFSDSINVTVPLQPSNNKRLSLPPKFWKSPAERF